MLGKGERSLGDMIGKPRGFALKGQLMLEASIPVLLSFSGLVVAG